MAKRKKSSTKKKKQSRSRGNTKILSYIAWTLALIAFILIALIVGYWLGYTNAEDAVVHKAIHKPLQQPPLPEEPSVTKRLKEVLKKETTPPKNFPKPPKKELVVAKKEKPVVKKELKTYVSASHEIANESLVNLPKPVEKRPHRGVQKPKLAIIIDDVSTRSQVRAIKHLGMPLTMSFLPPSPTRPNSAKLAAKEPFYMVHLPMEAIRFNKEEPFTLHVNDSQATISKRVAQIKALFPKVHYINNHTGSKFTSNERAVNRLIYAFQEQHIYFIDSRTTAKTKVPKVMKNVGMHYMARDIFLDHHMQKPYILKQIRKAIRVAKAHGSAIAIGHPHKNTLQALQESKKLLQKEVDLVLIEGLE